MRASRLLSILTTLQAKGQVTAPELAGACEVSVRTIYRDIDALAAAGILVYAERGAEGGFRLLDGYRAATHWSARECLPLFGATISTERVCIDRNRITGGGVTAGIDFALTLVSQLVDRPTAEAIQLRLEYTPAPPFTAGSPDTAPPEVLSRMLERIAPFRKRRVEMAERAAARLNDGAT